MSDAQPQRYPPWWVYVLVIVPVNLAVRFVLPEDANVVVNGASTILVIGGLYWLITVGYRRATAGQHNA